MTDTPVTPKPRPIGISTCDSDGWNITVVLYDDGTVWQRKEQEGGWRRLPPIPQGQPQ